MSPCRRITHLHPLLGLRRDQRLALTQRIRRSPCAAFRPHQLKSATRAKPRIPRTRGSICPSTPSSTSRRPAHRAALVVLVRVGGKGGNIKHLITTLHHNCASSSCIMHHDLAWVPTPRVAWRGGIQQLYTSSRALLDLPRFPLNVPCTISCVSYVYPSARTISSSPLPFSPYHTQTRTPRLVSPVVISTRYPGSSGPPLPIRSVISVCT